MAIPLLDGVTSRDAKNADAYNWLAYATRKSGNPTAAIPISCARASRPRRSSSG